MKAIVVKNLGDASVLQYTDAPNPTVGPNEVLVNNKSIGINFIDIYHRTGIYKRDLPFVLGQEGAGFISEVGSNVKDFKKGDRIAYCMVNGAYAEYTLVPANKTVKLPDHVSFSDGAAVLLQGLTAQYLLTSTYPVKKETKLLIHAAAGGVGTLVVQMAKNIGAYTIATTSTEEKVRLVKSLGATEVINYNNFVPEVKRLTNNVGVDVVYDSIGKNTFPGSLDCLRPRGYFVLFGQSSGVIDPINPAILANKGSLFMTRPSLGNYIATREELDKRINEVFKLMKDKKLKVIIDSEYTLADAAKAQERLESRQSIGKILLKV